MRFVSKHWTDELLDQTYTGRQERKRTIRNWSNHRTKNGLWFVDAPDLENDTSPPPDWDGVWDFRHRQIGSSLHGFAVDSTDGTNRAMVGCRLSDRPDCWLNIKAMGVDNGDIEPSFNKTNRSVTWENLWTDADLTWSLHGHKLEKEIRMKSPSSQKIFRFALRYPQGFSHTIANNVMKIYDRDGLEIFTTRPPWGKDSSGSDILSMDHKNIGVSLIPAPDVTVGQRTFPTFRLVVNQDDLVDAVYPIIIDPTVTITGTTDLDDLMIASDGGNAILNSGGATNWGLGCGYSNGGTSRALFRINNSGLASISGTASSFVWNVTPVSLGTTPYLTCQRIAASNTWVEGSGNWSLEVGATCWNYLAYNTVNWTGSAGCGGASDIVAGTSSQFTSFSVGVPVDLAMPTEWIDGWISNPSSNQGWLGKQTNGAENFTGRYLSLNAGSTTVAITYAESIVTRNRPIEDLVGVLLNG